MRTLFDSVHFENCEPMMKYNSSGYNLTNKENGIVLLYCPKDNQWIGPNRILKAEFTSENATQQWFNTLTGEFTEETKFDKKGLRFWDERPWKYEADAIFILRNLEKKIE